MFLLVLPSDNPQSRCWNELHVTRRIPFRVKLHVSPRRLIDKRHKKIFLEVNQNPLVLLNHRCGSHVHRLTISSNCGDCSVGINRSSRHQKHSLEFLTSFHRLTIGAAKLERKYNFTWNSVGKYCFTRFNLKFSASRPASSVNRHHRSSRQSKRIHVRTHRTIN